MNLLFSIFIGLIIFLVIIMTENKERSLDSDMSRRLKEIKNKASQDDSLELTSDQLKSNIKSLVYDTEYKIQALGKILSKIELTKELKKSLKIAGVKTTIDVFLILSLGLAMPFFLLALVMPLSSISLILMGFLAGSVPFFLIQIKIKKRLEAFSQQFPDALGLIASSLRAGHSLLSSFQMVIQEMPDPINNVFKVTVDEISLGGDTREALDNMTEYMPGSVDLRFFVTAVLIQREIGGNLAEILDSLNYTIRERFKLIGQLNAQTAQAKLSGFILALAPAIIALIIWTMNPTYLEPLIKTTLGKLALVSAFIMAVVGFIIIKKITDIRI